MIKAAVANILYAFLSSKNHELEWRKIEVDTPILCNPQTQGKDNGSAQTDCSIEQFFSRKVNHGNEGDRTQDADQPEVEHRESKKFCKKGRGIGIKNSLVINMPGGKKRVAQLQDFLCGQIVESFIHP
jgi:hypothetical protein